MVEATSSRMIAVGINDQAMIFVRSLNFGRKEVTGLSLSDFFLAIAVIWEARAGLLDGLDLPANLDHVRNRRLAQGEDLVPGLLGDRSNADHILKSFPVHRVSIDLTIGKRGDLDLLRRIRAWRVRNLHRSETSAMSRLLSTERDR